MLTVALPVFVVVAQMYGSPCITDADCKLEEDDQLLCDQESQTCECVPGYRYYPTGDICLDSKIFRMIIIMLYIYYLELY